ncbi:hypothetical protein GJW58_12425 [Listeria monocytogenes]|nr:hypothetical protein [Listeria monocytogenes]EDN9846524.1 hypothetical protein [Listeria monocytogenes]
MFTKHDEKAKWIFLINEALDRGDYDRARKYGIKLEEIKTRKEETSKTDFGLTVKEYLRLSRKHTDKKIASMFGVNYQQITRFKKKNGLPMKKRWRRRNDGKR